MQNLRFLICALALSLFAAGAVAAEKKEEAAKPQLAYYYFDGWVLCSKITVIVNDLKKEHGKKIEMVAVKVGAGNSAEEIKKAKLQSHGIIAKDKSGKVVATVDGHSYGKEKVLEVIAKLQK